MVCMVWTALIGGRSYFSDVTMPLPPLSYRVWGRRVGTTVANGGEVRWRGRLTLCVKVRNKKKLFTIRNNRSQTQFGRVGLGLYYCFTIRHVCIACHHPLDSSPRPHPPFSYNALILSCSFLLLHSSFEALENLFNLSGKSRYIANGARSSNECTTIEISQCVRPTCGWSEPEEKWYSGQN